MDRLTRPGRHPYPASMARLSAGHLCGCSIMGVRPEPPQRPCLPLGQTSRRPGSQHRTGQGNSSAWLSWRCGTLRSFRCLLLVRCTGVRGGSAIRTGGVSHSPVAHSQLRCSLPRSPRSQRSLRFKIAMMRRLCALRVVAVQLAIVYAPGYRTSSTTPKKATKVPRTARVETCSLWMKTANGMSTTGVSAMMVEATPAVV